MVQGRRAALVSFRGILRDVEPRREDDAGFEIRKRRFGRWRFAENPDLV